MIGGDIQILTPVEVAKVAEKIRKQHLKDELKQISKALSVGATTVNLIRHRPDIEDDIKEHLSKYGWDCKFSDVYGMCCIILTPKK